MKNPIKDLAALTGGAIIGHTSYLVDLVDKNLPRIASVAEKTNYILQNPALLGCTEIAIAAIAQAGAIYINDYFINQETRKKQKSVSTQPTAPDLGNTESAELLDNKTTQLFEESQRKVSEPKKERRWLRATGKVITDILTGTLALDGLSRISFARCIAKAPGYIYDHTLNLIPSCKSLTEKVYNFNETLKGFPEFVLGVGLGSLLLLASGYMHTELYYRPGIIKELKVHYRFVPWFHWDWFKTHVITMRPYEKITGVKRKRPKFFANLYARNENKWQKAGTLFRPRPSKYKYNKIYLTGMVWSLENKRDPKLEYESCVDIPDTIRRNSDKENPRFISYIVNLGALGAKDTSAEFLVQERDKLFLERWYSFPLNVLRKIGSKIPLINRIVEEPKIYGEFGRLFDVTGNFGFENNKLLLDESEVFKCCTIGFGKYYELRDNRGDRYAEIILNPYKRAISLFYWRDYQIRILDERLNRPEIHQLLYMITHIIHKDNREHRRLRYTIEHDEAIPTILMQFKS